jgi:hypothetical protein
VLVRCALVRGRHSEVEGAGREVAPQLWHAALAAAPVTAVLAAVGAGAAGYFTHNADLAAMGALAGAAGAAAESARTRSSRVKARDERAVLREEVRSLAAAVERLSNEINARPAMPAPEPLPVFALAATAGSSMPVVTTFARQAEPATPLATVDVDDEPTMQIPRLATAPAHWTPAEPLPRLAIPAAGTAAPRLILGGDRSALPLPRLPATPIGGLLLPALRPSVAVSPSELRVIDLRSSSRSGDLTPTRMPQPAPVARRTRQARPGVQVAEPVSLFEPAAGLFEPRPRSGRPGALPAPPDPEAADGARHAWRGMRPGVPPSPFFTPGAFEGSTRTV